MDNNLFSRSENGYSVNEVEKYLLYLQTKFTKASMQNEEYKKNGAKLSEENDKLKRTIEEMSAKNKELYSDCVKFAKRLKKKDFEQAQLKEKQAELEKELSEQRNKANSIADKIEKENIERQRLTERQSQLEDELAKEREKSNLLEDKIKAEEKSRASEILFQDIDKKLNDQISLQNSDQNNESNFPEEPIIVTDEILKKQSEIKPDENATNKLRELISSDNNSEEINNNLDIQKNINSDAVIDLDNTHVSSKSNKAKKRFLTFLQIIFSIIFIFMVIFDVIVGIVYSTEKMDSNKYVFQRKLYVVNSDEYKPKLNNKDLLILKVKSKSDIKKGKLVLYDNNQDGKKIFVVDNTENFSKNSTFSINSVRNNSEKTTYNIFFGDTSFISTVEYVIPKVGSIMQFAVTNKLSFIFLIVLLTLIPFLFILLIPVLKKDVKKKVV